MGVFAAQEIFALVYKTGLYMLLVLKINLSMLT